MQSEYKIGDIIECHVTGIENYGIFVNIDLYYNGLIHISEISEGFVRDVHDYVSLGETIYCRVLDVDEKNGQLKLSIKDINYKNTNENDTIQETRLGFLPLKENLEPWIKEKLEEYKS